MTTVEGATDYDDGGILSSGASCEPPLNTPFPPYYGVRMITKPGSAGDSLVQARSSTALVSASAQVALPYSGFTPARIIPQVYSYLKNATSIGSAAKGSAARQTVPAYSVVVVQLHPAH